MNSFWKGFTSLFDWMNPKTLDENINDLDTQMQDLYDRMGWGQYKKTSPMSGWNDAYNFNRVLEAQKTFMDEIYGYNSTTTIKKIFTNKRDPARPRVNKYI